MKRSRTVTLAGSLMLAVAMVSAAPVPGADVPVEPATPASKAAAAPPAGDVQSFFQSVSGLFEGIEQTAKNVDSTAAPAPAAKAEEAKPASQDTAQAEQARQRSWKNSMIIITGGAASGAAIGAAVSKDKKGAIVGAVAGGVAGLIYDRVTYKKPGKI